MANGTALITGASMGIGLELAKLFAKNSYDVVLVARGEGRLRELASELSRAHGVTAHVVTADLSNPGAPKRIAEQTAALGLSIDHLVNNAGIGTSGPFTESDYDAQLAQIQVNVAALTALTRLYVPGMVAGSRGRILNVASTAGFQPGPGMAVYYATKAYVISFSEALAHELRGTGVTVTAHCPGATATSFAEKAGNAESVLFKKIGAASAADVAEHAYRSMMAGRVVAVHGALNGLGAFSVRLTPRPVVRSLAAWVNSRA